jgi:hypothetical protein
MSENEHKPLTMAREILTNLKARFDRSLKDCVIPLLKREDFEALNEALRALSGGDWDGEYKHGWTGDGWTFLTRGCQCPACRHWEAERHPGHAPEGEGGERHFKLPPVRWPEDDHAPEGGEGSQRDQLGRGGAARSKGERAQRSGGNAHRSAPPIPLPIEADKYRRWRELGSEILNAALGRPEHPARLVLSEEEIAGQQVEALMERTATATEARVRAEIVGKIKKTDRVVTGESVGWADCILRSEALSAARGE